MLESAERVCIVTRRVLELDANGQFEIENVYFNANLPLIKVNSSNRDN